MRWIAHWHIIYICYIGANQRERISRAHLEGVDLERSTFFLGYIICQWAFQRTHAPPDLASSNTGLFLVQDQNFEVSRSGSLGLSDLMIPPYSSGNEVISGFHHL